MRQTASRRRDSPRIPSRCVYRLAIAMAVLLTCLCKCAAPDEQPTACSQGPGAGAIQPLLHDMRWHGVREQARHVRVEQDMPRCVLTADLLVSASWRRSVRQQEGHMPPPPQTANRVRISRGSLFEGQKTRYSRRRPLSARFDQTAAPSLSSCRDRHATKTGSRVRPKDTQNDRCCVFNDRASGEGMAETLTPSQTFD